MQQPPPHPMGPMGGGVPAANITTEQIQKYLDENKQLILAILDNQNLGRLAECAQYQAQLQKNLLYLAAIADAQPQSPAMRPQMIPPGAVPTVGGQFMQQPPVFPPKTPLQFTPQQVQELQQQQQQQHHQQPHMMPFQGHPGVRPVGAAVNGTNAAACAHAESSHGGAGAPSEVMSGSTPDRRASKQEASAAASEKAATAADSQKNATEKGNSSGEQPSNPKRPEESKTP